MKILDSDQMRSIDRRATEEYGIASVVLMENAALAAADVVVERFPDAARAAVFCGTGNNGGDGFALARHLANRGLEVGIFLVGDRARIAGDALANLEACDRAGLAVAPVDAADGLERAVLFASRSDLVIDAIFGTGLQRPASGLHAEAILALNALEVPRLALDLPSGLDASTATVPGPAIEAAVTVTFAAPKIAHVFGPAAEYCGDVVVADISIPDAAVEAERVTLSLIEPGDAAALFQPRASETHKGTYGHVAVIAGSEGRSGAAILAARGAIRAGAGLVTVLTDVATANIVDAASAESMTYHIFRTRSGIDRILAALKEKDAVVLGPGLPDDDEGYAFVRDLLPRIELPTIVDASALNAFRGAIQDLASDETPRVLTPHPGELARLVGVGVGEILDDRVGAARAAAARAKAVVVLKGHQTLVATPDGEVRVNPTGNAGMASGGMGDVLSGMIGALLAQGADPAEAAAAAVWLHGFTGDLLAEETADIGLAARDLAEAIPRAIGKMREIR
ncbi:MAG TPA: NAD(P)H-hydrate dehydratase [Thermoanaerobaculia bacterium]